MGLWLICVAVVLLLAAAGWWAGRMALGYVMLKALMNVLARAGYSDEEADADGFPSPALRMAVASAGVDTRPSRRRRVPAGRGLDIATGSISMHVEGNVAAGGESNSGAPRDFRYVHRS